MTKAELEASLKTLDIFLMVFGIFVAIGVAPRSLSVEQERDIAAKLAQFASQHADLFAYGGEPEIANIGNQLLTILTRAHWSVSQSLGQDQLRTVAGILVELGQGSTVKTLWPPKLWYLRSTRKEFPLPARLK
jgi:hypothetical protein